MTEAASRRPKSLILDLYGRYSAQFRGWIAVSDLVDLMALLGVDEQAVRSSVSRMARRQLLAPDVRDRVRGYRATAAAEQLFADADRRIYASMEPARPGDGWVLVSFSVPETEREKRHVLRSKLVWHGLGNLSSGLWIGPARLLDDVVETVKALEFAEFTDVFRCTYEGLGDAADLVRRSWDLDALADSYRLFVGRHAPVRDELARRRRRVSGEEAFTRYTNALHEWRKFPYLDPGLPVELLPVDWPGSAAATLFGELRDRLEPRAFEFTQMVAQRSSR